MVATDINSLKAKTYEAEDSSEIEYCGDQIWKVNVNNFNEGLEFLGKGNIAILDIDGTMMSIRETILISADSMFGSIARKLSHTNIVHTILEKLPIEKLILRDQTFQDYVHQTRERLVLNLADIKVEIERRTGNPPLIVTNRIAYNSNATYNGLYGKFSKLFHAAMDKIWGTTALIEIFNDAGFEVIHNGLDRQTGGLLTASGRWNIFINDITSRVSSKGNTDSKFVLLADNLNLIGPIANEQRFLEEMMQRVSVEKGIKYEKMRALHVNIKKDLVRSVKERLTRFGQAKSVEA